MALSEPCASTGKKEKGNNLGDLKKIPFPFGNFCLKIHLNLFQIFSAGNLLMYTDVKFVCFIRPLLFIES
jgi:hypothetical protein